MLRARANGETFVSATMCPQQYVLVCQGLIRHTCEENSTSHSSTYENYFAKQSVLNVQSKAFSRGGVKIWNWIPTSLKNLSKNSFKKVIRTKKLIEISLETENSYAEIYTIINKMKNLKF